MPLGLLQRVSKLVNTSSNAGSHGQDNGAAAGQRVDDKSATPSSSQDVETSKLREGAGSASGVHDEHDVTVEESKADAHTQDSSSAEQQSSQSRSRMPSLKTSQLDSSHGSPQPALSVTPATPISPTSGHDEDRDESSRRSKLRHVQNHISRLRRSNSEDELDLKHVLKQAGDTPKQVIRDARSIISGLKHGSASGSSIVPNLRQEAEEEEDPEDVVIAAKPMKMSDTQQADLLHRIEEEKRVAAEENEQKRLQEEMERPNKETMAEQSDEQDHFKAPEPKPRHPHLHSALERLPIPPKPSVLQRLPSQAIDDTPDSETASSPALSRKSSLRNAFGRSEQLAMTSEKAEQSGEPQHRHERYMSQRDARGRLPGAIVSAVQDIHQKVSDKARGSDTDYRFPTVDAPEAIREESPPSSKNERTSTLDSTVSGGSTTSPPSSAFLDVSRQFGSPRSSSGDISAASSVNEYSTPAGFLKHRRSSSQTAPREVKETYNAGYKDLPDGKRKLNQYVLTGDIGRGSFGVVQIAKNEETGENFAAKEFSKIRLRKRAQSEMIRRQARGSRRGAVPMRSRSQINRQTSESTNKNDLELIRSEIAIMKKLDHPNVVKLYEVLDVQQDDSLFMIVELCKNGPVIQITMGDQSEPMKEDQARNYFRQIILAIEYLHQNGIIHRDIKPENILLMEDDNVVKLVDFGVSEMFSKDGGDGDGDHKELKTGGSPAFMAPELCMSGTAKVSGKAADVWALGITLYCMLVGRLPFEGTQMLDLYDKIKGDSVKYPETLSPEAKDVLEQLLVKDPNQRILMRDLREHPWLTRNGQDPLPSTEVNVTSVEEVTENDIDNAIAVPSVSYIVNAVRAANRWRRFAARRTQSEGAKSEGGSSISTDMSRNQSIECLPQSKLGGPPGRQNSSDARSTVSNTMSDIGEDKATGATLTTSPTEEEEDKFSSAVGLKSASSFPQSSGGRREKDPNAQTRKSPLPSESTVDFPEVDAVTTQEEHLSNTGIDDSSVEMLRHYEESTGHLLPRSAVEEEIARSRRNSPLSKSSELT